MFSKTGQGSYPIFASTSYRENYVPLNTFLCQVILGTGLQGKSNYMALLSSDGPLCRHRDERNMQ